VVDEGKDSGEAEIIGGIIWKPSSGNTKAELVAKNRELQHLLLKAEDRLRGLEAETKVLRERLRLMEATDLGVAFARVDKLEDQREGLLHELNQAVRMQRSEAAKIKASTTWKVGSMITRPVSKLMRRSG
jgi:hypothetical protein